MNTDGELSRKLVHYLVLPIVPLFFAAAAYAVGTVSVKVDRSIPVGTSPKQTTRLNSPRWAKSDHHSGPNESIEIRRLPFVEQAGIQSLRNQLLTRPSFHDPTLWLSQTCHRPLSSVILKSVGPGLLKPGPAIHAQHADVDLTLDEIPAPARA